MKFVRRKEEINTFLDKLQASENVVMFYERRALFGREMEGGGGGVVRAFSLSYVNNKTRERKYFDWGPNLTST